MIPWRVGPAFDCGSDVETPRWRNEAGAGLRIRDRREAPGGHIVSTRMWRFPLMAVGSALALLSTGIARNWVHIENGGIPLLLAIGCWVAAVRGLGGAKAAIAWGCGLIFDGVILFFVMPKVVNNGSGQDAVDGFAMFVGGGATLVGLLLIALGAAFRAPTRDDSDTGCTDRRR